jgi:glutamate-5-semialdehyde dehydrogenase
MGYQQYFEAAQLAGRSFSLSPDAINNVLVDLAAEAIAQTDELLAENKKDLDRMDP